MSATSTCTRPSASRTAAAAQAWVRSVAAGHLAPVLPGNPLPRDQRSEIRNPKSPSGPVSAAPYGSAASCHPLGLHRSHGRSGLAQGHAGRHPHANYIAKRLEGHYPTLYVGRNGAWPRVHRRLPGIRSGWQSRSRTSQAADGLRLPRPDHELAVPGTLMIEPTESESKAELDRFCDALILVARRSGRLRRVSSTPGTTCSSVRRTPPRPWPPTTGRIATHASRLLSLLGCANSSSGPPSAALTTPTATATSLHLSALDAAGSPK